MAAPGSGSRILDAVEEVLSELPGRVRGTRVRLSTQALSALRVVVEELSLVTRDDYEELELRVAQLEHRLALLEGPRDLPLPDA